MTAPKSARESALWAIFRGRTSKREIHTASPGPWRAVTSPGKAVSVASAAGKEACVCLVPLTSVTLRTEVAAETSSPKCGRQPAITSAFATSVGNRPGSGGVCGSDCHSSA